MADDDNSPKPILPPTETGQTTLPWRMAAALLPRLQAERSLGPSDLLDVFPMTGIESAYSRQVTVREGFQKPNQVFEVVPRY